MNKKMVSDNEPLDYSDEYWREEKPDASDEAYFPLDESKPPHY